MRAADRLAEGKAVLRRRKAIEALANRLDEMGVKLIVDAARQEAYTQRQQERMADLSSTVQETLSISGIILARTMGRSEQAMNAALAELSRTRTTITIAHRLSTVRHADMIVVLEHGRVVEHGSHDRLYAARGAYWALLHPVVI